MPSTAPSDARTVTRPAGGFVHAQPGFQARAALAALLDQAMVAEHVRLTIDGSGHAAPGQRLVVDHRRPVLREPLRNRLRYRVIRVPGQARDDGGDPIAIGGPIQRAPFDESRLAFSDGAGLVERDRLQVAGAFKMDTALDQDAAPRRGRQPADDRHRRRNDQCAGARDDQQHQGLVDGLQPRPAEQPGPRDRNQHREDEHGWRVDRGEAVDEALRRRPVPLGLLDRVNDPRQRGIRRQRRHLDLEQPVLVDRSGEDRVARFLVDRDALAGHGRLVDARVSGDDDAVERDAFARPDAHDRRAAAPLQLAVPATRRWPDGPSLSPAPSPSAR